MDEYGQCRARLGYDRFARPLNGRPLSVMRPDLELALRERLSCAAGLRFGVGPARIDPSTYGIRVTLTDSNVLDADLLVGGRRSALHRACHGLRRGAAVCALPRPPHRCVHLRRPSGPRGTGRPVLPHRHRPAADGPLRSARATTRAERSAGADVVAPCPSENSMCSQSDHGQQGERDTGSERSRPAGASTRHSTAAQPTARDHRGYRFPRPKRVHSRTAPHTPLRTTRPSAVSDRLRPVAGGSWRAPSFQPLVAAHGGGGGRREGDGRGRFAGPSPPYLTRWLFSFRPTALCA